MKTRISEQFWLLVFSGLLVLLALAVSVWLILSGQIRYLEGIFLLLACGVLALVAGLNIKFLLRD